MTASSLIPKDWIPSLSAGETVDRYEIERLFAVGGTAEVYTAVQKGLKRRVAFKLLRKDIGQHKRFRDRFSREGEYASRIKHANVVHIIDVGETHDLPYLVTEFVEGGTLHSYLESKGRLKQSDAVSVLLPICAGVAAGHDVGVVHRDLKPENILLAVEGPGPPTPKIMDFGMARASGSVSLTKTGKTLGTPHYMSPEQARAAKDIDGRSDQFALAIILFELLTGRHPHPGNTAGEVMFSIGSGKFDRPSKYLPDIPPFLESVILKALSLSPKDRYASVRAFGSALLPFSPEREQHIFGRELQHNPAPHSVVPAEQLFPDDET